MKTPKYSLFLLLCFVAGCTVPDNTNQPEYIETDTTSVSRIGNGKFNLYTVQHDGHDYVVYSGYKKGGLTHSASCPANHE